MAMHDILYSAYQKHIAYGIYDSKGQLTDYVLWWYLDYAMNN